MAGLVELDDASFGALTEDGKPGRDTKQTPVLVAYLLTNKERRYTSRCKSFEMASYHDLQSQAFIGGTFHGLASKRLQAYLISFYKIQH